MIESTDGDAMLHLGGYVLGNTRFRRQDAERDTTLSEMKDDGIFGVCHGEAADEECGQWGWDSEFPRNSWILEAEDVQTFHVIEAIRHPLSFPKVQLNDSLEARGEPNWAE
jgi:hypothetical protein